MAQANDSSLMELSLAKAAHYAQTITFMSQEFPEF